MARKARTPAPPKRPVQAPKVRTAPRDVQRTRKTLYAVVASGLLLAAAIAAFLLLGRGGDDDGGGAQGAVATLRQAGWTYRNPKSQGREHVPELQENFKYNSVPATSGPHSNQTVIYGVYDDPVSELHFVHNLEHGAVGIFYGEDVPEQTVARLQEYYREEPNGLVLAPDTRLEDEIALVSWTHVARGTRFDEEALDTFIETFGFKGPESCKTDIEQGCFRRADMDPGGP